MKRINSRTLLIILSTIITIMILGLLIGNIIILSKNGSENNSLMLILFSITFFVSLFLYGLSTILIYKNRLQKTYKLVNSMNSIDATQEEIFEVGTMIYNDEQKIIYITPWIQKEGFSKFLGKKISKLDITIESNKIQNLIYESRIWEIIVSRKNKTIFFKDVTNNMTLKEIINSNRNAVLSIHTSFSKKINFNDSIKSEIILKINHVLQDWTTKIGGVFNISISSEGTATIIFKWKRGEKDIINQTILKDISLAISNFSNDATISIGVSYGIEDFNILFERALKTLELSKNRGGDQIVLERPDGETEYIGVSKSSVISSSSIDIKKFYISLISDLEKAREIFITSHNIADLDSVGSAMGIWELFKKNNKNIYIVMDSFDMTTKKLIESYEKSKKDLFISEKEAINLITNKSHIIITDVSNPKSTQATSLIDKTLFDRISIIDHHRINKEISEFDGLKMLIETSVSSSSEIIVEMLKNEYGPEAQSQLDKDVSTSLLAGIQLDSKQLTKNVTNTTFEAVSFLLNNNANRDEILSLFKPTQSLIKIEAEALRNILTLYKGVLFTFIDESRIIPDEYTSIVADKLLQYEGVEATFVLGRVSETKFKLSARSNDKINVQNISEALGGGGHFNVAAASWNTNIKYSTIQKRIINVIVKGKNNG